MGKALYGTHTAPSSLRLLDEVRSLRERVAELEAALAAAEATRVEQVETEQSERQPAAS
jgi:predicted nuclease with TOPRIM domain